MNLLDLKTNKNQGKEGVTPQHGSAIVVIFILIALFAALSYIISRGTRGGSTEISREKAQLAATEILDYASAIKSAVQTMQINDCDESWISFENPIVSGYANPQTPADNSCRVFHPSGGALNWQNINTAAENPIAWHYHSGFKIANLGENDNAELIMTLNGINQTVCEELNTKLGLTNPSGPPVVDTFNLPAKFAGDYDDVGAAFIGDNGEETIFSGRVSGCFEGSPAGTFYFYQVLISR